MKIFNSNKAAPAPDGAADKNDEHQIIYQALLSSDYSTLIAPDETVEQFLQNDAFWEVELQDDRDIPLKELVARDPTFIVVGKELELLTGKLAIVKAMKLEYSRQARFQELSDLLLTIAFLKQGKFAAYIEDQERSLIDTREMDWEAAYLQILDNLSTTQGLSIDEVLVDINQQREALNLTLRIREELIAEKLHEEMPNPVTFLLLGDMGAGKSFIQRRLEKWRQRLYSKMSLSGYDRLLLRDRSDANKAYLRTLPSGEGRALLRHYDGQERTRRGIEKWCRRALVTLLAFPPVYQAVVLGWEMAKYQWGELGDINPLVDLGVWINDNFQWVALYAVLFIYSQVERWVRDSSLLDRSSLRPQWIVDSLRSESVIIGDVEREKIVGSYETDFKRPPQLGLVELPNWLQTDGKSLIIEQLSDLSHDAQSIFAQLVQEREFSIADRGEYTTSFLSFLSIGQNPHVMKDLIPPLKDRLKLGGGCVVVNAVEKDQTPLRSYDDFIAYALKQNAGATQFTAMTECEAVVRSRRIERKFMAFIKDFRQKAGAKPFDRGALVFLIQVSSAFADSVDRIIINREFLGYLNALLSQSTLNDNALITKQECAMTVLTSRTPDQKILIRKIANRAAPVQGSEATIGAVRLLALSRRVELGEDPYLQDVADENSLGYIAQIRARVSPGGSGDIHLLRAPMAHDECRQMIAHLRLLLTASNREIDGLAIHVDMSNVLCKDETLLAGAYVAIRSALESRAVHADALIAFQLTPEAGIVGLPRLNQRLMTTIGQTGQAHIHAGDRIEKIEHEFFDALASAAGVAPLTFNKVSKLAEFYSGVTHDEPVLSEKRSDARATAAEASS